MQNATESTPATQESPEFPRLSRWLDMLDEALGIKPESTEK